jgi:hypothetical protein
MEYAGAVGALSAVLRYNAVVLWTPNPLTNSMIQHSHGKELVDLVVTLRDARSEIAERVSTIKSHWLRTQAQLVFAKRAWSGLSEIHRESQLEILKILHSKVRKAEYRAQGLIKKRARATSTVNEKLRIKRTKYLFVKPFLDTLIKDLNQWQQLYDPTWFLIMKIAHPIIDDELRRKDPITSTKATAVLQSARKVRSAIDKFGNEDTHVFLPADGLQGQEVSRIRYSKAMIASRADWSTPFLLDSIPCESYAYVGIMMQDIRRLAGKLKAVDPSTFGLLKCQGAVKIRSQASDRITSFEMVFLTPPPAHKPRTLRQYLTTQSTYSLTDRIHLANRLAASVNYVHTLDFVHKNVRPENILTFTDPAAPQLGDFYLIGFEQVRSEDGRTYLRGSNDWEQNIYRHPERQGSHPKERYNMQHDIYSLGVCLLEIGLWSSFVSYGEQEVVLGPGAALGISKEALRRCGSSQIKEHLVGLARSRLPSMLGEMYTEVVLSCLKCLDSENEDYGEIADEDDADGVVVGVRFIQKVCGTSI